MTHLDQREDFYEVQRLKKQKRIEVGEHTYIDLDDTEIRHTTKTSKVVIGKFCQIGGGLKLILGGNHRHDWFTTYPFNKFPKEFPAAKDIAEPFTKSHGHIIIGHDVWIGMDVTILSGVTIGSGAVIGANSVIRRDVPAYSVVYGNPAEIQSYRIGSSERRHVMEHSVAWWDWPIDKINALMPYLCVPAINTASSWFGLLDAIKAWDSGSSVWKQFKEQKNV